MKKDKDDLLIQIVALRLIHFESKFCDAPKPGGPLTTRQPAEYR